MGVKQSCKFGSSRGAFRKQANMCRYSSILRVFQAILLPSLLASNIPFSQRRGADGKQKIPLTKGLELDPRFLRKCACMEIPGIPARRLIRGIGDPVCEVVQTLRGLRGGGPKKRSSSNTTPVKKKSSGEDEDRGGDMLSPLANDNLMSVSLNAPQYIYHDSAEILRSVLSYLVCAQVV
jgi:hypothetical protein